LVRAQLSTLGNYPPKVTSIAVTVVRFRRHLPCARAFAAPTLFGAWAGSVDSEPLLNSRGVYYFCCPISAYQTLGALMTFRGNGGATLLAISLVAQSTLWSSSTQAQGLECPTIDRSTVAAFTAVDTQMRRLTTDNKVALANEVDNLVHQVKAQNPGASNEAIADLLLAAYCSVVARKANVATADKWHLMRQFDRVLMEQLAANAMPAGSSVIANVPLSATVYRDLSQQAKISGHSPSEFMATILTTAAGP
jgi:hypothetical protein